MMDINDLRGLLTALLLLAFVGLCFWAWSGRRKADFEASALLPLEDDMRATGNDRERR
jgi:cytochrome c oxidase cbb3-type subunit 4